MGGIFISYRSGTHAVTVGALADRLEHYFGPGQVFIDNQMIAGTRYPEELKERLLGSDVLIAVIHDGWTDEFARQRTKDWVRFEIATALRQSKPVVPVLLENADPPLGHQLPADVAELAELQAARVRGARFRPDLDHLVWLLERHIAPVDAAPPEPPAAPKPNRVGRRFFAWAAGLFLLAPLLLFEIGPLWQTFAFPAFGSATILAGLSILSMTLTPAVRRLTRRWEDEAGTMSVREAMRRRWILPALGALPSVYFLYKWGTQDGEWQEWEVVYLIVIVLVASSVMQRMWRRYNADDDAWPPPVTTEPAAFRRAAYRLRAKLTSDPDWRGSRSRAAQREAELIYGQLIDVGHQLKARATASLTQWIRTGYSHEITAWLGWLASILALDAGALIALTLLDSATVGSYVFIAITVAAAVLFTAAKTLTELAVDRRAVRRWIQELSEWEEEVKPMIFR